MKKLVSALALTVAVLAAAPSFAATPASSSGYGASSGSPDYISGSLGAYDFDKNGGRASTDYRVEYQWGSSLIPMLNHDWASLDRWVQLHPTAGLEGNGNGMFFLNGGLNADVPLGNRFVFTWGETVGWYSHGDDKQPLGSPVEVRSQLELDYRFDNAMRVGAAISHLSNLGWGDKDPGAEILGAYLRIPTSVLARR